MSTTPTRYTVLQPDGTSSEHTVDWPAEPRYDAMAAVIRPLLGGAVMEHVAVLHDGGRRDMFVDETSAMSGLVRNEAATTLYRHAWMSRNPTYDPEALPAIYGTAVFFPDRRVWF